MNMVLFNEFGSGHQKIKKKRLCQSQLPVSSLHCFCSPILISDRVHRLLGSSFWVEFPPVLFSCLSPTGHNKQSLFPVFFAPHQPIATPSHTRSAPGFAFLFLLTLRMASSRAKRAAALKASADIRMEGIYTSDKGQTHVGSNIH